MSDHSTWRPLRGLIFMMCILGAALPAAGQSTTATGASAESFKCTPRDPRVPRFSGFTAYEENDSLVNGDDRYTQGLRLAVAAHPEAMPCFVQRISKALIGERDLIPAYFWVLGQNLYTPRILSSRRLDSNDRGFSDFNYFGGELSLTERDSDPKVRHTLHVAVGALGANALAHAAQGGLHALKLRRIPKGWPTTEPNEPAFYSHYRYERRFSGLTPSAFEPDIDLTYGLAAELGTVRASAGGTSAVRVGWNLSGFPQATITTGVVGRDVPAFEVAAFGAVDGRVLGWTRLVQRTPDSIGFSAKRGVYDLRAGGYVRYRSVRVGYQYVSRSPEFSIVGYKNRRQVFGSLHVGYEPDPGVLQFGGHWLTQWQAELGMGGSARGPKLDRPKVGGVTGHLALRKDIRFGFVAGLELSSVAVEGDPIPSEPVNNTDIMFRQRSLSLAWGRDTRFGSATIRVGKTWIGTGRLQTIRHDPVNGRTEEDITDIDFEEPGGGWLTGVQYFLPLERHMTIGVDITYHRVHAPVGMPHVVNPSYLKTVVVLRLRRPPPERSRHAEGR